MLPARHPPVRAVANLSPGRLQSWAADVIEVLREAHKAVEDALASGDPALDAEPLAKLRQRYDEAVAFGITHKGQGQSLSEDEGQPGS